MDNNINILIVEDDPIIAADLEDRLQDMGYHVIGAFDTANKYDTYYLLFSFSACLY